MKKIALHPNDWQLIRSYLLGGAGLGAGVGLTTALINQIKDLKREADDENTLDKDVLKLTVRPSPAVPKMAAVSAPDDKTSFLRAPTAIVGGLLAAGGSYAAVRAIHQYLKKREMEQELERAQNQYIDIVGQEGQAAKTAAVAPAAKGMGMLEGVSAIPLTLALLTGLSSAAVTNQVLKKSFPDRQSATRMAPKKVIVKRDVDGDQIPDEEAIVPYNKMASAALVETAWGFRSGESDIEDLVCAAASGRLSEMRKMARDFGTHAVLSTVRGAARLAVSPMRAKLAAHALVNDPELGPTTELLAAAEFLERAPQFTKLASNLDAKMTEALIDYHTKLACEMQQKVTWPELSALLETSDAVKTATAGMPETPERVTGIIESILGSELPMAVIPGVDLVTA